MAELTSQKTPLVILDDDVSRAQMLASAVEGLAGDAFCVEVAPSAQALTRRFSGHGPTVLFVGLQASWSEHDALELVRTLLAVNHDLLVVFVDGSPTMAYEADEVEHVALLPAKPQAKDVERAVKAVKRALKGWTSKPFVIKTRTSERVLNPAHISYVESDRRILQIHVGDEVIRTYGKLSDLMQLLPNTFFQCHKSFLVNLSMVEDVDRESASLAGGCKVPVSQKRHRQTVDALKAYVGKSL